MSLPEIFKNNVDYDIKNSQETYYGKYNEDRASNLLEILPVEAIIETKNRKFRARIIGKTNNYIITNNQEVIYIKDCISIQKA